MRLVGVVTSGAPLLIIVEFAENGSLLGFLRQRVGRNSLTEEAKLMICEDVARGMAYLASVKLVHRDLACRNVLVSSDFTCKVSDFGMSREMSDSDYYRSRGGRVAIRWTGMGEEEEGGGGGGVFCCFLFT